MVTVPGVVAHAQLLPLLQHLKTGARLGDSSVDSVDWRSAHVFLQEMCPPLESTDNWPREKRGLLGEFIHCEMSWVCGDSN